MTLEEQRYYENFFDMFASSGWAQFLEELKDREEAYDISYLNDEKDLNRCKGELSIIRMIMAFETFIEEGYNQAKEPV
jgi:hypothetical protein